MSRCLLFVCLAAAPALAHGNDPEPSTLDELAANLVVYLVTVGLALTMAGLALKPILQDPLRRQELIGWGAVCAALLLGVTWWLTRQSLSEALAPRSTAAEHAHFNASGGQVAMWGDYHAEVARIESGEYRLFISDAYRRNIAAEHYSATIAPRDSETGEVGPPTIPLEDSVGGAYRFALLPREVKSVQLEVQVPGRKVRLNFVFDEASGRRSLPIWCGTSR